MQTLATWPGPGWAQEDLDILDSLVNKINAGVLLFSSPGRRDGRKEGKNDRPTDRRMQFENFRSRKLSAWGMAVISNLVPGSAPGCRSGNAEKLSSTQAESGQAIKSAVA